MTTEVQVLDAGTTTGAPLKLRVRHPQAGQFKSVGVEVLDAGVRNPAVQFAITGTATAIGTDTIEATFDTTGSMPGLYEVLHVQLQQPEGSIAPPVDLWARGAFGRALFEIAANDAPRRSAEQIAKDVEAGEAAAQKELVTPLSVREGLPANTPEYAVYVFVRDLDAQMHVRFRGFELVPMDGGVPAQDANVFVNAFMQARTRTGARFAYDQQADKLARDTSPGCAVHFPAVRASTIEEARDFGIDRTNQLLLALSTARDTSGSILEVVVIDHAASRASKFSVGTPVGTSRVTGPLGGPAAATLEACLDRIAQDPIDLLLLEMYRQARHDPRPAFQYVRYWGTLSTAAEAAGLEGSADGVVQLLQRSGVEAKEGTVRTWYARRTAAVRGEAWQAPTTDLVELKQAVQQALVHRLSQPA